MDYTNLRIFEGWIDYISSGSESTDGISELTDNYYRRMQYPENYKANTMYITKFEKDIDNAKGRRLDYLFVNAFPKLVNAIPVQYGGADILKVGVSFNYDRYIMNPGGSVARGNSGSFTDVDRTQSSAELNQTQQNIDVSTGNRQPIPLTVIPSSGTPVGNTNGEGTPFINTDSATGYRGEGNPDGPLLYPNGTPVYNSDGTMRSQFD